MSRSFSRVFTLEVDGRPVLAFAASRLREAQQICKEPWLRDDLAALKSRGIPLRTAQSKLFVRGATPKETAAFEQAAPEPSGDMVLAFLVEIDGRDKS